MILGQPPNSRAHAGEMALDRLRYLYYCTRTVGGSRGVTTMNATWTSQTLTEGATMVEQRLKAAGAESKPTDEKLEKDARGFGESI